MKSKVEFPQWIDRFMTRWDKRLDKPLSESERQAYRMICKSWADGLSKMEREKLSAIHRLWIDWLQKEVTAEAESETERPDPFDENPPDWYATVLMELGEAYAPTINFKKLLQNRPTQSMALTFGEMIGHEYAAWNSDSAGLSATCEQLPEAHKAAFKAYLERERPLRLKIVEKAVSLATKQSFNESRQFFRGYTIALQKGTITDAGRLVGETYRTNIFYVLAMYPGFVRPPNINSVRELFEWLQIMLGKGQLNNTNGFKRVEKICQDIGLHFGPPGRPRGS